LGAFTSRGRTLRTLAWGGAFALLLALGFPFRAGELRFDLGSFAGWVALVPFVWMLEGLRPAAAFRWATLAATAGFTVVLYWLFVVVYVHGHAPAWVGVAAVLLMSLVLALHVGLVAALYAALATRAGGASMFVLPAAWVASEHLRSFDLFGGFPWAYLGYTVHADGPLMELAALGGVYGLSFLLAFTAGLCARGRFVTALAVVAVLHALGFGLRVANLDASAPEAGGIRAALVQASIPQDTKWDATLARQAFEKHLATSRLAAAAGPLDLIVWPESSVPVIFETEPEYARDVWALAQETGAVLALGGVGMERVSGNPGYRIFNSAFVVRPQEGFVDRYDKSHLVPFGEYVPLRRALGFLSGLATGLASGDITPGSGPRVLENLPEFDRDHALAALICYEVIYPSLVRTAVRDGARVLLNLTNDAWYGRTSAPHQFLAIAAMRSAEHGLPMLRAANTGVSAVVDAGGKVLNESPIFEQRALRVRVPPARSGPTLYTRFGDWVVWVSWGILIAIGGLRVVGRRERTGQGGSARAQGSGREGRGAAEASLTSKENAPA